MATETKNTKLFYNTEIPSDWSAKVLGDVGKIRMCKRIFNHETSEVGDIPFFKIGTFGKEPDAFIPKELYDEYRNRFSFPKKGEILISAAGTLGRTVVYDGSPAYFQDSNIVWIENSESTVINQYLFYLYQIIKYESEGGTIQRLYNSIISSAKFLCPPLPEQKVIAQILSTADAAIQTTEKLIAQKELRKKWLMQQLLTGKKRLKGFDGEWKEINIRDIAKEISIKNKTDKQLTVLSCTKYDGLVPSLEYFGRKIFADDVSTYKIVPKNHFAYATNHIEEGSIGYQEHFDEALISPMYTVFKTDKTVNDNFFYRLLKSHPLIYQYQNRMEGSIDRRGGLRWDGFSIIKIKLPSYEEQTAIAQVLQAADKEISLIKAKAEKLREQKKGLMQVLLTGKVRLEINDI
jgi:type I restriction enzyme S subunit